MSQLKILVNKLGHHLEEIRTRALFTIISKLDYGLINEEVLVDQDNIFQNLVKWFQYKDVSAKEDVLKLILRLIKNSKDNVGHLLLQADPGLAQLREVTDCDILVQDIVNLTSKQVNSARYTPSDNAVASEHKSTAVGTARSTKSSTSAVRRVTRSARNSRLNGPEFSAKQNSQNIPLSILNAEEIKTLPSDTRTYKTTSSLHPENTKLSISRPSHDRLQEDQEEINHVIWSLPRVSLVASDLHVLTAVEDSLANSSSACQSCHFFTSVILHDFPPEVFLQYPGVIKQLLKLMRKSETVNSAAVECLLAFTQLLLRQLIFFSQLEFTSQKSQFHVNLNEERSEVSEQGSEPDQAETPRDVLQQYQQEGYLSSSSDQQNTTKRLEPISLPQFCVASLLCAISLLGQVQQATPLVLQLLRLLKAVVPDTRCLWIKSPAIAPTPASRLSELAHTLLETLTSQIKQSVSFEPILELHVTAVGFHIIEALVSTDVAADVLPTELQEIICFSLLDPILAINYPKTHNFSLTYAKILKKKGMSVFEDVAKVLQAMEASVKFSRNAPILSTSEALALFEAALPALPFHQELSIIQEFTQYVIERRDLRDAEAGQAAVLTRAVLAHSEHKVALEAYRVCHNIVTTALGPRQALSDTDPLPRLGFIVNTPVLLEIVGHGVTNSNDQIGQYAEELLLHLLKCQLLVGEDSWRCVVEQMTPVMPLLQCHAGKTSPLRRAVLQMIDPDIATTMALSNLQVVAGNCRLLLHRDIVCREEAAARLLWLTRPAPPSAHKHLADVCMLDSAVTGHTPVSGMYEESSVVRVLEVLSGACVEARVRQSALTQLSVMTEDSRLHQVFLEQDGIAVFINILKNVLQEMNEGISGYVIPIISTLKHLARHNSTVRQNLANNEQLLICIIKSLFQLSEWRLQRDASQLLALLLFADFVLSSAATLSLPQLCVQSLCLPFPCQVHWAVSPNTTTSLKGVVLGQMGAQRLIAVQWSVLTHGLDWLLQLCDLPPESGLPLTLSLRAVRQVQHTHITHNCRQLLYAFQNATSHEAANQALSRITCFLELCWLVELESLSSLPWKNTFRKFLLTHPSGQDDFTLLLAVLKFLNFLLGVCPDQSEWISEALQASPLTLLKMIVTTNSTRVHNDDLEVYKNVCLWTISLCRACMQHGCVSGWQGLVQLILQCLGHSHTQNFYSLALLDCKLSCLLAAVSQEIADSAVMWQLLTAFHCESPHSFMGLSITRNTLLCLNKLLAFTKDWERKWVCSRQLCWLPPLCVSRCVLVRASALQLLSGLARSPRGAATILQLEQDIFHLALTIVIDHEEASIVREHAAILLTNILKNSSSKVFVNLAEKLNLYHEIQEAVSMVALTSTSTHTEPSSEMLFTHPHFIKAGCWLVNNLLASSSSRKSTLELISSSGLATRLFGIVSEAENVISCELVPLFTVVCQLLCYISCGCDDFILQDSLPALSTLLDSSNFADDSVETSAEVKSLWQHCFHLLAVVLSCSGVEWVLPTFVTTTLCDCIMDSCTQVKTSALLSVPAITTHLTPRDEERLCEVLLSQWQAAAGRVRSALLAALAALLGHSAPATEAALQAGLLTSVLSALHHTHLALTVQTSSTDKLKKNNPLMNQLEQNLSLLNNLLYQSESAKQAAAEQGAADTLHKLWVWCHADDKYQRLALDTLITLTANCPTAAQTLVLTSTMSGVGQRKTPSSHSLVHALATLLTKQQQLPPLPTCAKALTLLAHCCQAHDCRVVIAKTGLLARWSDQWASKKPVSEELEAVWLRFILTFTATPEGQLSLPKADELLLQLAQCADAGRTTCRPVAMAVLRNLAAHPDNRARFLTSRPLLSLVGEKLLSGGAEEQRDAALIVWALAANHQKAKVALRREGLVSRLQLAAAATQEHNQLFTFVADLLKPS